MEKKTTIEKLQSLPYQTRVKILWVTVVMVAVGLMFTLVQSIKSSIKDSGENLIQLQPESTSPESQQKFASVERVERTETALKIYFNFNNTTGDILNISKLNNIQLRIGEETLTPQKLTDRQGGPYVQKILSQTQNFGILTFKGTTANEATLVFDQLSLEASAANIFKQTLKLNLEELSKKNEIRN